MVDSSSRAQLPQGRKKHEYGHNWLHQWLDTIIQQSIGKVCGLWSAQVHVGAYTPYTVLYLYFAVLSCPIIDEASWVHIHASFFLLHT